MFGDIFKAIGGLWDSNENRKSAEKFNRTKIQTTVADAKAAGIHPLAALGSQAASSWATPVQSTGSAVGDAIGGVFDNRDKSLATENAKLQNELLRSQIKNTDAQTVAATSRTIISDATNKTRGGSIPGPEKTGLRTGGGTQSTHDTQWSDAQDFENRYGEMSDFIYGPRIWIADRMKDTIEPASRRFENRRARWHGETPPHKE